MPSKNQLNENVAVFELSLEQRQDADKAFKLFPGGSLAAAITDYADAIKRLEKVPLKNAADFTYDTISLKVTALAKAINPVTIATTTANAFFI